MAPTMANTTIPALQGSSNWNQWLQRLKALLIKEDLLSTFEKEAITASEKAKSLKAVSYIVLNIADGPL